MNPKQMISLAKAIVRARQLDTKAREARDKLRSLMGGGFYTCTAGRFLVHPPNLAAPSPSLATAT